MTAPGLVASGINETNEMSGVKSFAMRLYLFTSITRPNLSPVIDTKRMSLFLIQNRLNNPISQEQHQILLLKQQQMAVVQQQNILQNQSY